MNKQYRLTEILRKKGIGPQGSKSLSAEEVAQLDDFMTDIELSSITKTTLLTAMLMLEPTTEEQLWLEKIKANPKVYLSEELVQFVKREGDFFLYLTCDVIAGKDLSDDEATLGAEALFDPAVGEYKKASFLEAQRLKRETFIENKAFYNYMRKLVSPQTIDIPMLISLADSYDGVKRYPNYGLFTACVIAACGYPVLVHGIDTVAPKMGITHHQILKAAGKNPLITVEEACNCILDSEIAWAYIDEEIYFPELYALKEMRYEMVKRPFLATFEKLLQPIRSNTKNCIATAYTHAHYKEEVIKLIADLGDFDEALNIKGMEATTQPNLAKETPMAYLKNGVYDFPEFLPDLFLEGDLPTAPTIDAYAIAKEGMAALENQKNHAWYAIRAQATLMIHFFTELSIEESLSKVTYVLENQKALKNWNKYIL